ncbi:stage V sporulation protein AD [bacterium]|nr:stage V sporulation protein AD [bacterium]
MKFKNVYLNDYFTVVGPLENMSCLRKIDLKMDDYYFGEKTFELAEVKMQKIVIDNIIKRNNLKVSDIDVLIGGDLTNQIAISNYSAKDYNIPFLGVYSACATFAESLILGSILVDSNKMKKVMGITSSHNLTAERQFRYPVEYGAPRPHTSTFTATGAVSTLLSKKESNIKIESATIGVPVDLGITDANNLGSAMAPAAASTILKHLTKMKRDASYYDLVLTGDLGCVGSKILEDYLNQAYNIRLKKYLDAGCELYLDSQKTYAGGSGPSCLPIVLFNKILLNKKYKKILIVATGALHSPTTVNQRNTIPGIAHAISLEVLE